MSENNIKTGLIIEQSTQMIYQSLTVKASKDLQTIHLDMSIEDCDYRNINEMHMHMSLSLKEWKKLKNFLIDVDKLL